MGFLRWKLVALFRSDLQALARERLTESKLLLDAKRYSGAYYLCGYAVELGLKSAIARQQRRNEFPNKKVAEESHSHDLVRLVRASGLEPALRREELRDRSFSAYWAVVKDWTVVSRYQRQTRATARDIYEAVSDPTNGVWPWLTRHW